MGREPSKKGSKDDEKEENSPAWVYGIKCALGVTLTAPHYHPTVTPPVAQYLHEVSLGMVGGEGDPTVQAAANKRTTCKSLAVQRMKLLLPILKSEPAICTCQSLFWLAMAGIFRKIPEGALKENRAGLGESWYSIMLQVLHGAAGDRETQDFLSSALPFAFGQAIYRILVDAFVEDKPLYIKHGDRLLLKTSQIAHFELTGFLVTAETVWRGRQKLFLRRVLLGPHVDQQEFLRGKKRQEMLESHSAASQDLPLSFGNPKANPLEEAQLDHVWHGSEEQRRDIQQQLDRGIKPWEMETTPIKEDLSVARYEKLQAGAMIAERQLTELHDRMKASKVCIAEIEEDVEAEEEQQQTMLPMGAMATAQGTEPSIPTLPRTPMGANRAKLLSASAFPTSPLSPGRLDGLESPTAAGATGMMSPTTPGTTTYAATEATEGFGFGFDGTRTKHRKLWRKGIIAARIQLAKEDARSKKEAEKKARKQRQEAISGLICSDDLPDDLSQRQLNTAWVSPPLQKLAHAPDRHQVLNKTSTDTYQISMTVKGDLPQRLSLVPQSPSGSSKAKRRRPVELHAAGAAILASSTGSRNGETSPLPSNRGGSSGQANFPGSGILGNSTSAPALGLTPAGAGTARIASKGSLGDSGLSGNVQSSGALPRLQAAAHAMANGTKSVGALLRGEVLSLDPPARPKHSVVIQRLEEHGKAYVKNSFALYTKEHDIYTGARKSRSDSQALHAEENCYIREMDRLVGGCPKKLIAPEGVGNRHLRKNKPTLEALLAADTANQHPQAA